MQESGGVKRCLYRIIGLVEVSGYIFKARLVSRVVDFFLFIFNSVGLSIE